MKILKPAPTSFVCVFTIAILLTACGQLDLTGEKDSAVSTSFESPSVTKALYEMYHEIFRAPPLRGVHDVQINIQGFSEDELNDVKKQSADATAGVFTISGDLIVQPKNRAPCSCDKPIEVILAYGSNLLRVVAKCEKTNLITATFYLPNLFLPKVKPVVTHHMACVDTPATEDTATISIDNADENQ